MAFNKYTVIRNAVSYDLANFCYNYFLLKRDAVNYMYEKLNEVMYMTNKRHFGFENMELNENAQYTEYPEGGFYNWHMDLDTNMFKEPPVRKISMSLILSADNEFEGGGLEIQKPGNIISPKQGHAVFFASFINHRVVPVTRGVRKSLVVWFGGEPFK